MTAKQNFEDNQDWYIDNWDWVINGSYGEAGYTRAKQDFEQVQGHTTTRQHQVYRRIVINGFTELVAQEESISYGHAQNIITDTIPADRLKTLTEQFISELPDILG